MLKFLGSEVISMNEDTILANFEACKNEMVSMQQRIHVLELEVEALKHPKRHGLYGQEID